MLARNFSKVFGTSKVLDAVDLAVMPGEIHGLLGSNGSGKSTLIKTIAGLHAPEKGAELILYGRDMPLPTPSGSARASGISFVHQHLALIPSLSVLENMMLNDLASSHNWAINWARMRRHTREVFDRFDLDLDLDRRVADLPQADRALLAITRAFDEVQTHATGGQGILILDEPTPFLPQAGVDKLFSLMRSVAADGAAVIFVAHDIDEIREITDRATILRDGKLAGSLVSKEADREDFISHIVGEKVSLFQTSHDAPEGGKRAAAIRGLDCGSVSQVSFDITEGEIVGLTGLIGSGFDVVPEALFGAQKAERGSLTLGDGRVLDLAAVRPENLLAQGVAFLPSDRLGRAGIGSLPIYENMALPVLKRFRSPLGIDWPAVKSHCAELGQAFDLRPARVDLNLGALSGGNAQKALLAKWLQTRPKLLMLDEPTQGIDVGARQKIFKEVHKAARQGTAVIVASTDAEQLAQICHRILVFSKGCIVSELIGDQITKDSITQETLRASSLPRQKTLEVA
ncbi:MAG: hypothetical protein BM562_04505 [Alphaproteobacteria bacterium MedPE-SWcel]|nr:MAG: hypothetical protein BM562_04505 [Alphaproteobacteria bacterium MedPE-SWcel]